MDLKLLDNPKRYLLTSGSIGIVEDYNYSISYLSFNLRKMIYERNMDISDISDEFIQSYKPLSIERIC